MKITRKNIHRHELIGLEVRVEHHTNPFLEGIRGKVYWETKKFLWIKTTDNRIAKVFKSGGVFLFRLPDNTWVRVTGELINHRPEDRVKEAFRRG